MRFGNVLNQKLIYLFSEVFAVDIIFSQELLCPAHILRLQCDLSDTKTVDTIYHIIIYKLDEQVVILNLNGGSENGTISWDDETIENISSTEESSIFPPNEARLVVQIRLTSFFEMREDSVMFRCTIYGKVLKLAANEWKQGLTVRKKDTGKFC